MFIALQMITKLIFGLFLSASFARSSYAGYIPSEAPSLASPLAKSTDFPGYGSDYLNKDVNF